MRTLGNKELDAVAGGRLPRGDGLADWIDGLIASLTVSVHGSLDRTDGGGGSSVDLNADPSSWYDGGGELVSNNFNAEWASMMGPDGVAPSERAEYFSKWFEKATTNELTTLKGVIDAFKNTLIELKVPVLGQLIGHLMGMSDNLRDAISGVAPRSNCGWSFGIDVSNAYADAPNALMSYAGWKAIMNLWPSRSPGNI
jgi:hypothetical protein